MALSKQQLSNLRKELRENRTVDRAVTLSAEKRSVKIAKLQRYLDAVPEGASRSKLQRLQRLQKELEKFKSFTGLIAASDQEAQTTRCHVTTAVKDAKEEIVEGDIQPPSPEQLPTPTSVPATTDARPAKKQKVALSSPEQAPYQAPEQAPYMDAISLGSQTWRGLPKEDRAPYQEKAKAAKKQYDQDRKAFTDGGGTMKKCKTRKDNKHWELYFTPAADPNALAANLNGSLSFKCNKGVATRIQGKQSDSQNDLN